MLKISCSSCITGIARQVVTLLGILACFPAYSYQLVDLGPDVAPKDINNLGIIVGSRDVSQYPAVAFRYDATSGEFEDLQGTVAYAVNDAGQVAGNTLTGAFLLDGNNVRTWDEQGAYGISEPGQVAGNKAGRNPYRATSIPYNPAILEAGKWSVMDIAQVYPRGTRQGVYADIYRLDDVNDAGYAVGSRRRYGLAGSSAILITPPYNAINDAADVTYLPTPAGGAATAINNRNLIVGTTGNDSRNGLYAKAFIYDGSTLTLIEPLPGGLRSSGLDVNEHDTVVGSSETAGPNHAFVWDEATGLVDLDALVDDPDWVLASATAINDNGDIVGTGQLNGQNHGFLLTGGAVPPPPPPCNKAPVAVATADVTTGRAPLEIQFDGSGSDDPDGTITSYSWDFGDDESSVSTNPIHTYIQPGTYLVTLSVTDDCGDTATAELEIRARKGGKK